MKRWMFLSVVLVLVAASIAIIEIHAHFTPVNAISTPLVAKSHLERVPNSAFKYDLCTEAFAYVLASPDNPYKTDYTFHDPFRHADDTIIPRYLGLDTQGNSVSFSVQIIINQVATFNETIHNIRAHDGIAILLPDKQNHLQHSSIPHFIITLPGPGNDLAILDYTCPEQWVWTVMR